MILIDTSAWVDHFNGFRSRESDLLTHLIESDEALVISGLGLTEILLGLRNERDAARIASLLGSFELAPAFDRADYQEAGRIFRTCRRSGITLRSTIDCLIAQSCLRHGYELLSKDRDFREIAKCFPLKLAARAERPPS